MNLNRLILQSGYLVQTNFRHPAYQIKDLVLYLKMIRMFQDQVNIPRPPLSTPSVTSDLYEEGCATPLCPLHGLFHQFSPSLHGS